MSAGKKNIYHLVCRHRLSDCSIGMAIFYFVRSSLLHDKGAYPISYQSWLYILLFVPGGWLALYAHWPGPIIRYIKSQGWQNSRSPLFVLPSEALFSSLVFVWNDPHTDPSYFYIAFSSLAGIHFTSNFSWKMARAEYREAPTAFWRGQL